MEHKEVEIKCPYHEYIKSRTIVCEGVCQDVKTTVLQFNSNKERNEYIDSFCACECNIGCSIYLAIESNKY